MRPQIKTNLNLIELNSKNLKPGDMFMHNNELYLLLNWDSKSAASCFNFSINRVVTKCIYHNLPTMVKDIDVEIVIK